jgi:hypothetical protein
LRTVNDTVEEIIELASSENASVATLLRKCLVLANTLNNDHLQSWAGKELIGYEQDDNEPTGIPKSCGASEGFFHSSSRGAY